MTGRTVSDLPKFDDCKGLSPLAVFDNQAETLEAIEPIDEVQPRQASVPEVHIDMSLIEAEACFRQEAQQALESLSSAVHQIEEAGVRKISLAIQTVAGELFPQLSSEFLAEELALQVPELIKLVPPKVQVQASPRVAEHLNFVSRNMDNWPSDWAIGAIDELAETRVQIAWEQGGLTYDLDQLLGACLNRLGEHIIEIEEK